MMDEEIRQALSEVREMKQMCGNINMKLTNIVTQRGQDWKKKLEAEYQRGLEEGYERGLTEGKKAFDLLDAERDSEYQRGLDDAWEAARKIGHASQMKWKEMAFDFTDKDWCYNPSWYVVMNYTSSEAIAKLKAYEEKQKADDEIKVGDEVETKDGKRFVVTTFGSGLDGDIAVGVCADGLGLGVDLKELHKTGRHFDIDKILEEMRHD